MTVIARQLLRDGVDARAYPAAVVEVGRGDGAIWREAFGTLSYDAQSPRANTDTIFDLASLTKVIATASVTMQHVGRGTFGLDDPIAPHFEEWRTEDRRTISWRDLLEHASGLPAHMRLWERATDRDAIRRAAALTPLVRVPRSAAEYSDIGFIVLGFALESAGGASLDDQFAPIARALPGWIGYQPLGHNRVASAIAPTEVDPWRGREIRGEVHDENAFVLGGVAPHAGLFGNAEAVGAFARLVLATFRETTMLGTPDLMRTFATRSRVADSSRALAWDTMKPTSSCGTLCSPTAIGHTGFTGTSLWIDWARDHYVVLLTNRVHPTRANAALARMRASVHDAIWSSVI